MVLDSFNQFDIPENSPFITGINHGSTSHIPFGYYSCYVVNDVLFNLEK